MRRTAVEMGALAALLLGGALACAQSGAPLVKVEDKPKEVKVEDKPKEAPAKSKLEEMLQQALQNNPDLRVAAAKVGEAEAKLNRARLLVVQKIGAAYQAVEAQKAAVQSVVRVPSGRQLATLRRRRGRQSTSCPSSSPWLHCSCQIFRSLPARYQDHRAHRCTFELGHSREALYR